MPEEINEATAATTNAYVTLISFKVPDTFSVVLCQVTENGVNDIEYRIYGATDADFTSPQLIKDTTDVAAGANAFWVTGDPWAHMRVQIRSNVLAAAGNVTVRISGSAGGGTWVNYPVIPIDKGAIFNTPVALNTDFFAADLAPTNTPTTFRVSAALNAAGVLNVMRTEGGVTVTEHLNANAALVADSLYEFNVTVRTGRPSTSSTA